MYSGDALGLIHSWAMPEDSERWQRDSDAQKCSKCGVKFTVFGTFGGGGVMYRETTSL